MDIFDAGPLSDGARQCVFARGNPEADVMVIGEAPGIEEDKAGKPFIGPAGQLLDKMLASIGLTEETAYLTNVVNWRLPNNRKTTDDDIALCKPFLDRHIELAAPKVILMVGGVFIHSINNEALHHLLPLNHLDYKVSNSPKRGIRIQYNSLVFL